MEPSELADEVAACVQRAQARVGPGSIGAEQYHTPGQPQKFETISMEDFLTMFDEEALDIINYGVMLSIKINRLRRLDNEGSVDSAGIVTRGDTSNDVQPAASPFIPAAELHGLLQEPPSGVEDT